MDLFKEAFNTINGSMERIQEVLEDESISCGRKIDEVEEVLLAVSVLNDHYFDVVQKGMIDTISLSLIKKCAQMLLETRKILMVRFLEKEPWGWNAWKEKHDNDGRLDAFNLDLSNVDLSYKDLSGLDFGGVVLSGVVLDGANLSGSKLSGAIF